MTITRTYYFKIIPHWTIDRYNDTPVPSVFHSSNFDSTSPAQFNSKTSTAMPGWRYKIRHHMSATTGRTINRFSSSGGHGQIVVEFFHTTSPKGKTFASDYWSGHIIYPSSYPSLPSSSAAADNDARMKFYKRAKQAQTAFNGLTFLGELGETLRMIKSPGKALRKGLDDYVKHVKKRVRRAKRSNLNRIVSETWLEHIFGWQPLISDIKDAGSALNRRLDRFASSYTIVSGSGVDETASFDATLNTNEDVWLQYVTRRLHRTICSVRYKAEFRSVNENPVRADMNLFGASWGDIIPTAWELIPYSFLVDYFTNIGDVLNSWSVRKGDIAWCNQTVRNRGIRTLSELRLNKAYTQSAVTAFLQWQSAYISTSPFRSVREQITRGASIPGYPDFRIEIPGLSTKWINMSALVASRNRTRRQMFR